jgi:hypothetical protein
MATIDENLRRVPPQSLEAEESVLGGVMLDNTALDRVVELLQPDDFYAARIASSTARCSTCPSEASRST